MYARRTFQAMAFVLALMTLSVGAIEVENYTAHSGNLTVTFKPFKKEIALGDRFEFEFMTSRDVYLYLFAMDKNNQIGQVLLKDAKYKSTKAFVKVPADSNIIWKADKVGIERFLMIASTKKIDQDWRKQDVSKSFADFLRNIKNSDRVKIQFDVTVLPQRQLSSTRPPGATPVAFVSTARQTYRIGDAVKILYGADQAGTVTLYLVEPSGKREEVLHANVDGKKFYKLNAKAIAPVGDHKLIAEFAATSDTPKGLALSSADQYRAIYKFKVVE